MIIITTRQGQGEGPGVVAVGAHVLHEILHWHSFGRGRRGWVRLDVLRAFLCFGWRPWYDLVEKEKKLEIVMGWISKSLGPQHKHAIPYSKTSHQKGT